MPLGEVPSAGPSGVGSPAPGIVHRGWLAAFAAYLLVLGGIVAAAYLGRIDARGAYFPYWDQICHFVLIGLAAALLRLGWRRSVAIPLGGGRRLTVASAALVVGAATTAEELAQLGATTRTFDPLDLLASLAGVGRASSPSTRRAPYDLVTSESLSMRESYPKPVGAAGRTTTEASGRPRPR